MASFVLSCACSLAYPRRAGKQTPSQTDGWEVVGITGKPSRQTDTIRLGPGPVEKNNQTRGVAAAGPTLAYPGWHYKKCVAF